VGQTSRQSFSRKFPPSLFFLSFLLLKYSHSSLIGSTQATLVHLNPFDSPIKFFNPVTSSILNRISIPNSLLPSRISSGCPPTGLKSYSYPRKALSHLIGPTLRKQRPPSLDIPALDRLVEVVRSRPGVSAAPHLASDALVPFRALGNAGEQEGELTES